MIHANTSTILFTNLLTIVQVTGALESDDLTVNLFNQDTEETNGQENILATHHLCLRRKKLLVMNNGYQTLMH